MVLLGVLVLVDGIGFEVCVCEWFWGGLECYFGNDVHSLIVLVVGVHGILDMCVDD